MDNAHRLSISRWWIVTSTSGRSTSMLASATPHHLDTKASLLSVGNERVVAECDPNASRVLNKAWRFSQRTRCVCLPSTNSRSIWRSRRETPLMICRAGTATTSWFTPFGASAPQASRSPNRLSRATTRPSSRRSLCGISLPHVRQPSTPVSLPHDEQKIDPCTWTCLSSGHSGQSTRLCRGVCDLDCHRLHFLIGRLEYVR
jgi:hypothetical protein